MVTPTPMPTAAEEEEEVEEEGSPAEWAERERKREGGETRTRWRGRFRGRERGEVGRVCRNPTKIVDVDGGRGGRTHVLEGEVVHLLGGGITAWQVDEGEEEEGGLKDEAGPGLKVESGRTMVCQSVVTAAGSEAARVLSWLR